MGVINLLQTTQSCELYHQYEHYLDLSTIQIKIYRKQV